MKSLFFFLSLFFCGRTSCQTWNLLAVQSPPESARLYLPSPGLEGLEAHAATVGFLEDSGDPNPGLHSEHYLLSHLPNPFIER